MAEELLLVFSTFPDTQTAQAIGKTLVEEKLAACVNLIPGIESIYRWQGKVEAANEVMALIKTTIGQYQQLETRVKALHPYQVPEIVSVSPVGGLPDYLNWAVQACNG